MRTSSMECPKCGSASKVYSTKHQEGNNTILRYRKCPKCGYHFGTIERAMKTKDKCYKE